MYLRAVSKEVGCGDTGEADRGPAPDGRGEGVASAAPCPPPLLPLREARERLFIWQVIPIPGDLCREQPPSRTALNVGVTVSLSLVGPGNGDVTCPRT